jgi:hypothetical protein
MLSQWKALRLLLILFMFLSFACEGFWEPRSVVTNLPAHQPLLVINSFINPDSVFEVFASKSSAFGAPPSFLINDATVTIFESGNLVAELFQIRQGTYRATNYKPRIGVTYELRVSAEGFKSVRSTATIPSPIKIDSVVVTEKSIDRFKTNLTLFFQDPPGEDNYYQLLLYSIERSAVSDTLLSIIGFSSSDAVLRKPEGFEDKSDYYDDAFFDDALFDGEFYDLDISFYTHSEPIEMFVVLLTTSKSYYNFRKSVEQQKLSEGNPFAEPVPIYTNIENGLGVFAGYSSSIYSLR